MNNVTISVLWKSFPYGWSIRSLDMDGNFQSELLLTSPPFRCLQSGLISEEHVHEIAVLAQKTIDLCKIETACTPAGNIGYLMISHADDSDQQSEPVVYYYFPREDARASTRYYIQIVYIIDSYLRNHIQRIASQSDIWDSIDPSDTF